MPYMLSTKGKKLFEVPRRELTKTYNDLFTEMQRHALNFFHDRADSWYGAADVAKEYGFPNGQYFRGVLASLHKRGYLTKGD